MSFPKGTRVQLVSCSDPYTDLRPGAQGTVSFVDSMGTVHVTWDSGSNLGMIPGEDEIQVVKPRCKRGGVIEYHTAPCEVGQS